MKYTKESSSAENDRRRYWRDTHAIRNTVVLALEPYMYTCMYVCMYVCRAFVSTPGHCVRNTAAIKNKKKLYNLSKKKQKKWHKPGTKNKRIFLFKSQQKKLCMCLSACKFLFVCGVREKEQPEVIFLLERCILLISIIFACCMQAKTRRTEIENKIINEKRMPLFLKRVESFFFLNNLLSNPCKFDFDNTLGE